MATNLLLCVIDAVVSTVNGLIDGIKYVWNNPLQTIEGVNFFSRALHSGTEENDLLVQMIKESGKELSKEFIEGDADKKARMLGQAVGEVLLALVSTKGVTAAVDAIKAGIKSGELASWFSKFSKGTATAEDIANGLGKTAEAVDKADDSVKIINSGSKIDDLARLDEIEVKFNYSSKYDEAEFARQLEDQQKGMNELTVQEYLDNRQKYIEQGRAIESNAAQQAARENAYLNKVNELRKSGLSADEAKTQAESWMNSQAALHNPDQVAGGNASNIGGVGDKGVNSSIGSQWRYRIDAVDEQIQKMAENMTEAERNSTYLNVNLTY